MILFQSLFWTFLRWRISLFGEEIKGGTVKSAVWAEVSFRGEVCRLRVTTFDFRRLCTDVTHPRPSRGGSFGCCFLLGNKRFEYNVSSLERGLRGV